MWREQLVQRQGQACTPAVVVSKEVEDAPRAAVHVEWQFKTRREGGPVGAIKPRGQHRSRVQKGPLDLRDYPGIGDASGRQCDQEVFAPVESCLHQLRVRPRRVRFPVVQECSVTRKSFVDYGRDDSVTNQLLVRPGVAEEEAAGEGSVGARVLGYSVPVGKPGPQENSRRDVRRLAHRRRITRCRLREPLRARRSVFPEDQGPCFHGHSSNTYVTLARPIPLSSAAVGLPKTMLHKPIGELTAADLQHLVDNAEEESLCLEFKRELSLAKEADKKEAAKDVSGMANAAGGRIVYGIEEKVGSSGRKAAGAIVPLTDPDLRERLDSSLASSITPRVSVRIRPVPVPGGYCLVVEVPPSFSDLHMVTAYGDSRYHARTESSVVRIQEPEVRRRYEEIGRLRAGAGERMKAALVSEEPPTRTRRVTMLGVPLLAGAEVVDPATLYSAEVLLKAGFGQALAYGARIVGDGLEAAIPSGVAREDASLIIRVRRDGVIHKGSPHPVDEATFRPIELLRDLLNVCSICQFVWLHSGVRGPAAMVVSIPAPGLTVKAYQFPGENLPKLDDPSGRVVIEARIQNTSEPFALTVARHIFDRLWQHLGRPRCDYFTATGELEEWVGKLLNI